MPILGAIKALYIGELGPYKSNELEGGKKVMNKDRNKLKNKNKNLKKAIEKLKYVSAISPTKNDFPTRT